jgi:BolA-like protein 3
MLRATMRRWAASAGIGVQDLEAKLMHYAPLHPVKRVSVKDASSGCGSFFQVEVVSEAFVGKPLIQQHRLVNDALREEIKQIHGLTITTRTK